MAFSNYLMKGRRSLRNPRYRYRQNQENDEDSVQIDFTKDINLITYDILKNVCQKQDISEEKYLAYLNAFVKLLIKYDKDYFSKISYCVEDIFICVRITLLNDSSLVRAAGLRALRYMIKSEQHVAIINRLQYPALIARSLDLILARNDSERVQALRLTRSILIVAPHLFHMAIARSLMCVALSSKTPSEIEEDKQRRDRKEDEDEDKCNDRMACAFIAVITELCILNQDIFLNSGGVRALMHSLAVVRPGRMSESILGALLSLLNLPHTRSRACVDLQFIAASFTELPCLETKSPWSYSSERPWYHVALLSLLRSWPGVLHFCHPHDSLTLKSLVATLYLNNLNVRKAVLEVLHELLGLPTPEWTDEFSVILEAVDPARFQDDFKLSEGFVAKEAKSILPHISKCRVNISQLQLSLVLYCLLEADILNALIYVIISEDTLISVSATILLGEIMHLAHKQLPPECVDFSPAVPNLVSYAVRGRPVLVSTRAPPVSLSNCQSPFSNVDKTHVVQSVMELLANYSSQENIKQDVDQILNSHNVEADFCIRSQQRALSAVTALSELNKMFRKRPAPASIFLDLVLSHVEPSLRAHQYEGDTICKVKGKHVPKHKISQILSKESDEAIKDSGVLTVKDAFAWNWEAIRAVFKTRAQPLVRLQESSHKLFVKKIVYFLLPSNNQLSRCDLSSNIFSLATIDLLKFLLDCDHNEASRLLEDFLADLHDQIEAIVTAESAHDTLLSPKNVTNTLCQHYFLFIGVLSNRPKGLRFLETSNILDVLNRVALNSKHDCYVKLIVSCLDYSTSAATRLILTNVLTCEQVSSRLYATQFLSILLRTRLESQPSYLNWVVESLVNQLRDESKQVSHYALASLDEACDNKNYLDAVIALRPSVLFFGDKGLLLLIRFLSSPSGFSYLNDLNFVSKQLENWAKHFNFRYVQLMEADILDCLTLHRRTEDGHYTRRLSNSRPTVGAAYVLPHLYAMLARHEPGFAVLKAHPHLYTLFQTIISGRCASEEQTLELKASLWAVGNLGTSPAGLLLSHEQGLLLPIIRLVEHCPVYSVRATAFYTLSLLATTKQGVAQLHSMGWMCIRQNRHELWPVLSPAEDPLETAAQGRDEQGQSSESSEASNQVTPLFFMGDSGHGRSNLDSQLPWFRKRERTSSERRSATLPHRSAVPVPQHFRSYSESKAETVIDPWEITTDVQSHVIDELSDMRMSDVYKKSRSDSCCTDSSTSGVSSCDSSHVPRYHAIGEKVHQTLSPIPSTGSIATMKSVHPKPAESSNSASKHRNSFSLRTKLMPHHSLGHSTFLSLRNLRPHPSPSVSLDLINFSEGTRMSPLVRPKLSAKYMHQPVSCQFEVTEIPDILRNGEESESSSPLLHAAYPSSRSCIVGATDRSMLGESEAEDLYSGPCYQGICLPLHLSQLFPPLDSIHSHQRQHRFHQHVPTEATSDQDAGDSDNELEDNKKPSFKHDRSSCLLCVVKYAPNRSQILRNRKISSSSIHRTRSETESSYGGGVGGEGESPVLVPWPQQKTPGLCEITPASGESMASHDNATAFGFAKALMDSSSQSRSSVRKELLRLAEIMANPILFRTCKQGLLTIKQSCKDLFQDVCVYSDVCNILANCNHRLLARRFLQDLFIDSTFNELQEEPKSILTVSPVCSMDTEEIPCVTTQACDSDVTGMELAVILEGEGGRPECEEVWCPESKSDQILETFSSIYTSDSIDELSDETLFLKPCSSRLVLTSPNEATCSNKHNQAFSSADQSSLHLCESSSQQNAESTCPPCSVISQSLVSRTNDKNSQPNESLCFHSINFDDNESLDRSCKVLNTTGSISSQAPPFCASINQNQSLPTDSSLPMYSSLAHTVVSNFSNVSSSIDVNVKSSLSPVDSIVSPVNCKYDSLTPISDTNTNNSHFFRKFENTKTQPPQDPTTSFPVVKTKYAREQSPSQVIIASCSESNDENFDRNRSNAPQRIPVEVVIEQIPRDLAVSLKNSFRKADSIDRHDSNLNEKRNIENDTKGTRNSPDGKLNISENIEESDQSNNQASPQHSKPSNIVTVKTDGLSSSPSTGSKNTKNKSVSVSSEPEHSRGSVKSCSKSPLVNKISNKSESKCKIAEPFPSKVLATPHAYTNEAGRSLQGKQNAIKVSADRSDSIVGESCSNRFKQNRTQHPKLNNINNKEKMDSFFCKKDESNISSDSNIIVKKSVPPVKTSPLPNELGSKKALELRKSLPCESNSKCVELSARKSLPLTSSERVSTKPLAVNIKSNGLGTTSAIPVVSQHRKISVFKPPIPGMSD